MPPDDPILPDAALPLEVRREGGVFCVIPHHGDPIPIRLGADPVSDFHPGWTAIHVVTLFAPIHLLALRHVDGHQATWFLDRDMAHIGGSVREMQPAHRALLHEPALALFRDVMDRLVKATRAQWPAIAVDLTQLGEQTLIEMLELVRDALVPPGQVVDLHDPAADARLAPLGLDGSLLRATLSGSLLDDYRARMQGGAMLAPSPFDGTPVEAEAALMMPDRVTVFRHSDHVAGHTFYIATKDFQDTRTSLYIPGLDLYCVVRHALPYDHVVPTLIAHMALHRHRLVRYLQREASSRRTVSFVSDFPALHIGHVVWNDLSGLEELVATVPPDRLPLVCVLGAESGTEVYGPLDVLFPEFEGRVLRPPIVWNQAAAFVYESDLFFVRYQTRYVRSGVGARVQAQVRVDPRLDEDRALARRLAERREPCVLLGLRVGNRTVVGFAAYLIDLIEHLQRRLGTVTVVLDGGNARLGSDPTTSYGSFGPPGQEEPLVEELRIVFAVRRRFAGTPVRIVSTVGTPMATNLFWIMQSRFFVAPWGAALAKYRWICNRPGFVVTNRNNLAHPEGDLLIYNSPRFVEASSPMRFIALESVADDGPPGFYTNFRPDPTALHAALDELIAETMPDRD